MEKWLLVVRANCADQSSEGHDRFNDWYDNMHVPDLMTIPGFIRAARYINPDLSTWDTGKYLAIYDIETENIHDISTAMSTNWLKWKKQGRISDLLVVVSMTFYRQMSSHTK